MKYSIIIAPKAKRQIDKLTEKAKNKLVNALQELRKDPHIGKPLKAQLKGLFSYRIGDYRIIYDIVKEQLIIQGIKVMYRKDVYRK